jgi:hypothetical protein
MLATVVATITGRAEHCEPHHNSSSVDRSWRHGRQGSTRTQLLSRNENDDG